MRLLTRLLLSHTMPILVMAAALGITLVALVRMTVLLGEVRERELGALQRGEALHRGGWAVEVAMRRALIACEADAPPADVTLELRARLQEVEALAGQAAVEPISPMAPLTRGYAELARSVVNAAHPCERLLATDSQRRRWELDEQLTDAWAEQTSVLHAAVAEKDEQARRVGAAALSLGVASAVAALLLGLLVAQRLSSLVTAPLGHLARLAHRVGEGDFSKAAPVQGPREIEALASEFDRMRARLAELELLKQSFLSSVSHELRTPLTKIREALSLLGDGAAGPVSEKQRRLLTIASTACEREIRTVRTLLDLSRIRSGMPVQFQAGASIDEAVRQALDEEAEDARGKEVVVSLELQGAAPGAQLDAMLVERAVANLIRNAVGVSRPGQRVLVRREVLAARDGRPGPWAVVTVKDEGPGIPQEIRGTMFGAFVTHPVANSPKGAGVGLGLALAREVARAHGGELELVEQDAPGAVFRLWLLLTPARGEVAA